MAVEEFASKLHGSYHTEMLMHGAFIKQKLFVSMAVLLSPRLFGDRSQAQSQRPFLPNVLGSMSGRRNLGLHTDIDTLCSTCCLCQAVLFSA